MDRARTQPPQDVLLKFFSVVGNTATGAAQGEGGTDNGGKADPFQDGLGFCGRICIPACRNLEPDPGHGLFEQVPVLGFLNGLARGPDQLHLILVQDAAFG